MNKPGLFDEFSEVSAKQWKQKIQYDLKGADYNDTLVWESPEGIKIKPFYNSEDVKDFEVLEQKPRTWKIAQSLYVGDTVKTNKKARGFLKKGVESLIFTVPNDQIDLVELLKGIEVPNTPIHFNFSFLAQGPIEKLLTSLKTLPTQLHLHVDSIGNLARTGNWYRSQKEDTEVLQRLIHLTAETDFAYPFAIDTTLYQNAGANLVQQLAYGLSHAHEYLNEFSTAFPKTAFKVAVGGNYFFEIAKIRALRWLWASLASDYGIDTECHILAVPSKRNKTLYDYNVNMLRTTSECMSGILGGADTICNLPYDALYHKDNDFAERISRNQLILLKEESYFENIAHVTNGAFYIESLTHQLAQKALALFKQIEASGGFLKALETGKIQQKIKESALKEQTLFDAGETILLGTNAYQDSNDRMKGTLELYPFTKKRSEKTKIIPIIEKRWAEEMEQKRLDNE
nr:methylmalonyl-CoA mutase subunit beta [uncultured Allomuricauda sp.]